MENTAYSVAEDATRMMAATKGLQGDIMEDRKQRDEKIRNLKGGSEEGSKKGGAKRRPKRRSLNLRNVERE